MQLPAFLRRPDTGPDPVLADRTECQTRLEERINVSIHSTALFLSVVGCGVLVNLAYKHGTSLDVAAVAIYGGSMCLLFLCSVLYHGATGHKTKPWLQVADYAAVFLLIAGSYTPFTLITLHGPLGWRIFWIAWTMAIIGAAMQLFMAGRYRVWGLVHYIASGWAICFAIPSLLERLPFAAFLWMLVAGVAYTFGTVFYLARQVRFSHIVWHSMVLVGTACTWYTVMRYVVPAG